MVYWKISYLNTRGFNLEYFYNYKMRKFENIQSTFNKKNLFLYKKQVFNKNQWIL